MKATHPVSSSCVYATLRHNGIEKAKYPKLVARDGSMGCSDAIKQISANEAAALPVPSKLTRSLCKVPMNLSLCENWGAGDSKPKDGVSLLDGGNSVPYKTSACLIAAKVGSSGSEGACFCSRGSRDGCPLGGLSLPLKRFPSGWNQTDTP